MAVTAPWTLECAVITITTVSGRSRRMAASAASPSMPGSWRSTSATSGARSPSAARAVSAVPKDRASTAWRRRNVSMAVASPASSSMIITLRTTVPPSDVGPRERDPHAGPAATALQGEAGPGRLEELAGERQAEPGPAGLRGEERLEGARERRGGHPGSGVLDPELDVGLPRRCGEPERAARGHGIERVADEAEQRL